MKRTYYALIGDLVGSREAEDRPSLEGRIREVLTEAGELFAGELLARPVLTKGIDEISAVANRPDHLFDLTVMVNLYLWPLRFRFGIGGGTLDIGVRSGDAAKVDGPALHRAADAIARANRDRLALAVSVPGLDNASLGLFEAVAAAHRAIMMDWSNSAARVVFAFRTEGTQVRTAESLGVTQQFVSKELGRAHHQTLQQLEAAARCWLTTLGHPQGRRL